MSVTRTDTGLEVKQVEGDIYAPAYRFSNNGITNYENYAVSGARNNNYEERYDADGKAALKWADSYAKAINVARTRGSSLSANRQSSNTNEQSSTSRAAITAESASGSRSSSNRYSSSGSSSTSSSLSGSQSTGSSSSSSSRISAGASTSGLGSRSSSSKYSISQSGSDTSDESSTQQTSVSVSGGSSSGTRTTESRKTFVAPTVQQQIRTETYQAPAVIRKISSQSNSDGSGEGFSLHRKVSVKAPRTSQGPISFFTPVQHKYEASGEVTIERNSGAQFGSTSGSSSSSSSQSVSSAGSSGVSSRGSSRQTVSEVSRTYVAPTVQTTRTETYRAPTVVTKTSSSNSGDASGEGFSLHRKVNVKTPRTSQGPISFFTPVQHKYEASGEVTIARDSGARFGSASGSSSSSSSQSVASAGSSDVSSRGSSRQTVSEVSRTYVAPTVQAIRTETYRTPTVVTKTSSSNRGDDSAEGISLHRKISVKAPRTSEGPISFFTPIQHKYEATGEVTINRN